MTHEEKVNYMRMAANLCKFGFENHHVDLLVSLYDGILKKEGKITVRDIVDIEYECKDRRAKEKVSVTAIPQP